MPGGSALNSRRSRPALTGLLLRALCRANSRCQTDERIGYGESLELMNPTGGPHRTVSRREHEDRSVNYFSRSKRPKYQGERHGLNAKRVQASVGCAVDQVRVGIYLLVSRRGFEATGESDRREAQDDLRRRVHEPTKRVAGRRAATGRAPRPWRSRTVPCCFGRSDTGGIRCLF